MLWHLGRRSSSRSEEQSTRALRLIALAFIVLGGYLAVQAVRGLVTHAHPEGIAGAIAVALAALGLYGVLAFIVAQRRREIGVRMALGATRQDVIGDVMGHGLRLAAIGVAIGLGLALIGTRLLEAMLFGTSRTDAVTFVASSVLIVAVTAVASALPALRASRVDPIVALRDE